MENLDFKSEDIQRVVSELHWVFDMKTIDETEEHYQNSPYLLSMCWYSIKGDAVILARNSIHLFVEYINKECSQGGGSKDKIKSHDQKQGNSLNASEKNLALRRL